MSNTKANKATEFFIQVRNIEDGAVTPQSSAIEFVKLSTEQLEHIALLVEAAEQTYISRINTIANKPAECSIEFGVNVGGEAGVPFITKGTFEANFEVAVKWIVNK